MRLSTFMIILKGFVLLGLFLSTCSMSKLPLGVNVLKPSENQQVDSNAKKSLKESIERFSPVYTKQGRPRIVIMWNKQFDAIVSDWELSPAQLKYAESLRIHTKGNHLDANFESQSMVINKRYQKRRRSPIEYDFETFKTSFMNALLLANVNLIDRDTIIRLKGASNSEQKSTYQLDSKKLETEALIGYSDFVMELLFIPTPQSALGYSASVEITDISTGKTIAKLINELPEPEYQKSFRPSQSGFELKTVLVHTASFESIGESLATDTLSKLAERWQ